MLHGFRDPEQLVYHYTSAETARDHILASGTLRLSTYEATNDPRETKAWAFALGTNENRDLGAYPYRQTAEQFSALLKANAKVCCFSTDAAPLTGDDVTDILNRGFAKPRMWTQYGHNHAGVCLVFHRDALVAQVQSASAGSLLLSGQVTYRNRTISRPLTAHEFMLNVDLYESLGPVAYARSHVQVHHRALFFEKLRDWSEEAEWRLVRLAATPGPEHVHFKDALVGVIHGAGIDPKMSWSIAEMTDDSKVTHMGLVWKNGTPWYDLEAMHWSAADRQSPWAKRP